jgi:signal transduction histidine kinase
VAGNPAGDRRVSIATSAHTDGVLVEVTDNGCGVPDPERIFETFYSTTPGGLGMGLAIVRSIKMNKQIAAELGTGEQNIKVHRGRLMRKLGLRSVAELVRLAERLGVPPVS